MFTFNKKNSYFCGKNLLMVQDKLNTLTKKMFPYKISFSSQNPIDILLLFYRVKRLSS